MSPLGTHVLVVEDDDALRRLFSEVLVDAGFVVRTASDGADALHQLNDVAPDAVVLDLALPWVNGLEVLSKMRERPALRGVPVIVVTGTATRAYELRSFGRVALLRKPFNIDGLPATVRELLAA
jgi:DNA-binding response OmpR family regulator